MDDFTEEDLARMTPEERAAVTAEDDGADLQSIAGDDDENPEGDGGTAAGTDPAPAPAATDTPAEEEDDDVPVAPFVAKGVENYDQLVEAQEARKDEAFQKLMSGELSDGDYRKIEREVSAEIRKLDQANSQAQIAASMTQQAATTAWISHVEATLSDEAKNGINIQGDNKLMAELDRTVKILAAQVQADPSLVTGIPPTREGALVTNTDKWVLREALSMVKARNGLLDKAPKPPSGEPRSRAGKAPDLSGVPPTLARVPVAGGADVGGDEFAHMSNLTGSDYEKAIARMSPEQYDRFISS